MPVKVSDLTTLIEEIAPLSCALPGDRNGLLVGWPDKIVKRVLVSVDVTAETVKEAAADSCDMIISHHPLIFDPMTSIDPGTYKGRIIYELIRRDICAYNAHTNMDFTNGGINDRLAAAAGLSDIKIAAECQEGRSGKLPVTMDVRGIAEHLKTQLGLDSINTIGMSDDVRTSEIFVACGSVNETIISEACKRFKVLLTGEIKYSCALAVLQENMCAFEIGHFTSEAYFKEIVAHAISGRFPEIAVIMSRVEAEPIICI